MTVFSRHPDVLLVRILVFGKTGTDVRNPSVPIFAVLPPSRHAGLDPASPLLQKSGRARRAVPARCVQVLGWFRIEAIRAG